MLDRFKRFSVIQKVLTLFVGVLLTCCVCGVLLPSPDDSTQQPVSNLLSQATQVSQVSEEPAATNEADTDTGEALSGYWVPRSEKPYREHETSLVVG